MGIVFTGTATDIRNSAATLTGMFAPDLHEIMASFLCHSRKAHDTCYKINLGHDGLSKAFESIATFQSLPNESYSIQFDNNTSPEILCQDTSQKESTSLTDACNENTVKPTNIVTSIEDVMLQRNNSSEAVDLENGFESVTNFPIFSNPKTCSSISNSSTYFSPTNSNINKILPNLLTNISTIHSQKLQYTDQMAHDSLRIPITKLHRTTLVTYFRNIHHPHFLRNRIYKKFTVSNGFFITNEDVEIFKQVFQDYIKKVTDRIPISKREIVGRIYSSNKFWSVLRNLQTRFPDSYIDNESITEYEALEWSHEPTRV